MNLRIIAMFHRQPLELAGVRVIMNSIRVSLERDENGMTAVIEFLSAFTLFLMILTAFLSLAQLEMGSNDTSVDRLDRAAAQGLNRMTSDGGWFVPMFDDGTYDYSNSTSEWHIQPIERLNQGIVLAGLMDGHRLDFNRIDSLSNITEDNLARGIGLGGKYSLYLEIKITESNIPNRANLTLFSGGTERGTAQASSSSFKEIQVGQEKFLLILEIHNGGRKANDLHITEISPRSVSGSPEWIEMYNPNNFAIDMNGWSLTHTSPNQNTNLLLRAGVISGNSLTILTGDPNSQNTGNADHIIDLGSEGFLGVGQLNMLNDGGGVVILSYTQLSEFQPYEVMRVTWGGDTGYFLTPSQSLVYIGDAYPPTVEDWETSNNPTPGILP
ncbi:MAG TPA: lamin tail domain-containing protein [Candidatus Poseidoniales archaeon]|nr:MAG TPA: lamin tail domain-containing protein [Candidatus Poseidoniales archaeon]